MQYCAHGFVIWGMRWILYERDVRDEMIRTFDKMIRV